MSFEQFDTEKATEYTTLSKPTLDRLRVTGGGPRYAKVGSRVIYRRCDLDAWLESKIISSTSEAA